MNGLKLETIDAGKKYGKKWALRNVNCTIEPGTIGAIIGPNGAGKTTWMRLLSGICSPSEGRVLFNGEAFNRRDIPFRRQLFFLPDLIPANGAHSPLRHASMILNLYGVSADQLKDRLMDIYSRLDLLDCLESPLFKLSRGQFYKSALAPLLALRPKLWLLDEPFAAGMDPEGMMVFRELAKEASLEGCTVLFTTQILEIAENFSNRIYVLHKGQLVQSSTPDELAEKSKKGNATSSLIELLQRLRNGDSA